MASKTEGFRDIDDASLVQALADAKEALFNLRFQNATGQLDNHASIGETRRNVARIASISRSSANSRAFGRFKNFQRKE